MSTPEESARELLDVVPVIMRDIRSEMRSRRSSDLTVPQFRTLAFVKRNKESSLSDVANHMGLTLPSTSRLVDGLIMHGLMTREDHPSDRRRIRLALTRRGLAVLDVSMQGTLEHLANKLSATGSNDREVIMKAMATLRSVFMSGSRVSRAVK